MDVELDYKNIVLLNSHHAFDIYSIAARQQSSIHIYVLTINNVLTYPSHFERINNVLIYPTHFEKINNILTYPLT